MTAITAAPAATPLARLRAPSRLAAWATLAGRRISLSAHTPREILAPLATPLLFALVIAPALAKIIQATGRGGVDYSTEGTGLVRELCRCLSSGIPSSAAEGNLLSTVIDVGGIKVSALNDGAVHLPPMYYPGLDFGAHRSSAAPSNGRRRQPTPRQASSRAGSGLRPPRPRGCFV
jgi:hypothetical protein